MSHEPGHVDTVINVAKAATYTGGSGIFSWAVMHKEEINLALGISGLFFIALTYLTSLYFQIQRNKREEQEAAIKAIEFEILRENHLSKHED